MRWPRSFPLVSVGAPALLAMVLASTAFAGPVAVVASVKGRVVVNGARVRGEVPAVFGRALEQGDKVSVGPGGKATLFFDDGNIVELSERSSITIGGRLAGGPRGAALPGDVYAQVSRFATTGSRQTGLVAMAEMRAAPAESAPLLLSPRRTSLLAGDPSLSWRAVAGAKRYRVSISTGAGELWSREVPAIEGRAEVTLSYPADAATLGPGTDATWEVEALDDAGTLRREGTTVRVLAADQRREAVENLARIDDGAGGADAPAARFLAGSYLASLGLHQAAAEQFRALCGLAPESADPHEALGIAYLEMGLADLAAAEFQRALALQRASR